MTELIELVHFDEHEWLNYITSMTRSPIATKCLSTVNTQNILSRKSYNSNKFIWSCCLVASYLSSLLSLSPRQNWTSKNSCEQHARLQVYCRTFFCSQFIFATFYACMLLLRIHYRKALTFAAFNTEANPFSHAVHYNFLPTASQTKESIVFNLIFLT